MFPKLVSVAREHVLATVPAPIGGLNARDPIAAMPPTDAVSLVNFIPDTFGVRGRKGFVEWVINLPGANTEVQSIMPYFDASTTITGGSFLTQPSTFPGKLFCATPNGIFDITDTTDAPAAALIALAGADYSGWFSHVMMTNSGGSFLLACSEDDGYFTYDGTNWLKVTMGAGASEVSVGDPTDFCHVSIWKRRAWFVEKDSTKAWYLPVDSLYGAAASIDFGPLLKHGGHVSFIANWTIDAGEGIDDLLVVVGSNGDVLVYKGTDPAAAATFALVGVWYAGQIPAGRRAYCQLGGDLVLLSADGVLPMSFITRGGAEFLKATGKEYSSKIRSLLGQDMRASFTDRGWQLHLHPSERILIANVPNYGDVTGRQYVMSTTLNEWCEFEGIPIFCLGSTAGYTLAGTRDGRVLLLFTGFADEVPFDGTAADGTAIRGVCMPAFSHFGQPAVEKQFLMCRPSFLAADVPNVLIDVNTNFNVANPSGSPSYTPTIGSLWDVDLWDSAIWSGGYRTYHDWVHTTGLGFTGAAALIVNMVGDTTLTSIDYMLRIGGPI